MASPDDSPDRGDRGGGSRRAGAPRLYLYVARARGPVGRDRRPPGSTGSPAHTAKFHLDKLVEEGLLDTDFRRLAGRRGRGPVGRRSCTDEQRARWTVSLPERRYELAGELLAAAIEATTAQGWTGQRATPWRQAGRATRTAVGRDGARRDLCDVLAAHGYEPHLEDGDLRHPANCPFHALAREHTALVCGMNLHLLAGPARGARMLGVHRRPGAEPGQLLRGPRTDDDRVHATPDRIGTWAGRGSTRRNGGCARAPGRTAPTR